MPRKTTKDAVSEKPALKLVFAEEGDIYIHNKCNAEFHVPLLDNNPKSNEEAIVFQPNEVLAFPEEMVRERRFKKCFDAGFLERFNYEEYVKFAEAESKKKKKTRKTEALGTHPESGLSLNRDMAIAQINALKDTDLLEQLAEKDDRRSIVMAIEDRIEAIEDGEVDDDD